MSDDGEKVTPLPVRFKSPLSEDGPVLRVISFERGHCNHVYGHDGRDASYLIRDGETDVECSLCGTRLDPMFVLLKLANRESQWRAVQERYRDEMKRLSERSRTTCEHCGKMTRISRK